METYILVLLSYIPSDTIRNKLGVYRVIYFLIDDAQNKKNQNVFSATAACLRFDIIIFIHGFRKSQSLSGETIYFFFLILYIIVFPLRYYIHHRKK